MNQNLQSILEDSISYFDEIRAFKFSLDKIDISRASEKKIFENFSYVKIKKLPCKFGRGATVLLTKEKSS